MPLIDICGNHNRHEEHKNTVLQHSPPLALHFSLHAVHIKICSSRGALLLLLPLPKPTTHPPSKSPPPPSKYWWMSTGAIFFQHVGIQWHLCSIRTSVSDTIVSDCPSAAISLTATTHNGILVGRFNLYWGWTPPPLWANIIKQGPLLSEQPS